MLTPRRAFVGAVFLILPIVLPVTAGAQVAPDDGLAPTTSTTAQQPPETTTTSPPPPAAPPPGSGAEEGPAEPPPPPPPDVSVPPPAGPPPDPAVAAAAAAQIAAAEAALRAAAAARAQAEGDLVGLRSDVARLEAELKTLEAEETVAAARLHAALRRLKDRAVGGYMRPSVGSIDAVLRAESMSDLGRRFQLLEAVIDADRARLAEYRSAKEALSVRTAKLVTELATKQAGVLVASSVVDGANASLLAQELVTASLRAGGVLASGGVAFPIAGPTSYSDTFGAPRMFGTTYAHSHQGTDIFAAYDTPVVAVERGVLTRVGTDVLGGTKLWLSGASGTLYYYAHLSSFAAGVADGVPVQPGDVIGYVGTSGNAAGTSPHTHFQVHPGGGSPVNPYPLLRMIESIAPKPKAPPS